jgi:phosphate transport system substrate-binding protein
MTREHTSVSRRKFLISSGAIGAAAVAGCSESGGTGTGTGTGGASSSSGTLEADGSSTVYPIGNLAASYWNSNAPADDGEYWGSNSEGSVPGWGQIETDMRLANYFASLYGFESTGNSDPPYNVTVGLSHSGTGVEKVEEGRVDIGNSSAPVQAEKPDYSTDEYESFIDHVLGVDGQPLVVSQNIADEGVTEITGQELKDIYKGRTTNWSDLGGPDRDIQVLARVKGSGTRTAFVTNVFGDSEADTTVDNRYGQNQRLAQAISDSDNAISYLALAFLDTSGVAPIGLEWEGTLYEYESESNGLGAKEYPLSRDLHSYTYEGTSKKEAAFINMCLTDFGQEVFVAGNNYFKLPSDRRQAQKEKLPAQS